MLHAHHTVPLSCARSFIDLELEFSDWENRDDDSIMWILDSFETHFAKAEAADRKRIIACVTKILGYPPAASHSRVQTATARSLTKMDKSGLKALLAAVRKLRPPAKKGDDEEKLAYYLKLKADLIRAIGTFASTKTLKVLYEALDADESEIINAACDALGCFNKVPLGQRKPIVEKLIKRYASVSQMGKETGRKAWAQGRRHGRQLSDDRHYEIAGAVSEALEKLTGQSFYRSSEWQMWWRAHKKDRKWERDEIEE